MEPSLLFPKLIDNSKVVREVDPRATRERWALVLLVACLVAGVGLYAWPHLERRQAGMEAQQLDRERTPVAIDERPAPRIEHDRALALARRQALEGGAAQHLELHQPRQHDHAPERDGQPQQHQAQARLALVRRGRPAPGRDQRRYQRSFQLGLPSGFGLASPARASRPAGRDSGCSTITTCSGKGAARPSSRRAIASTR